MQLSSDEGPLEAASGSNLLVPDRQRVTPLQSPQVIPLIHQAGRAPTQASITKWFKAMRKAGIPQAWVHYPDGTKLEFRTTVQEAEVNTWADVA